MDSRDLGSRAWRDGGRHYGLTQEQVQRAVVELRDLINAHRGVSISRRHAGALTAESAGNHQRPRKP